MNPKHTFCILALALCGSAGADSGASTATTTISRAGLGALLDAYGLIRLQYVNQVDDRKLLEAAIGGMLRSLDPHSEYLDKEDLLALERARSGEYVGIGMELAPERGAMLVQSVSEAGPAERAGVRAGDRVISVDGRPVTGLGFADMARRVGGAPGSVLAMVLARDGEPAMRTLRIEREALHTDTVKLRGAGQGLAWIRIAEFGGATAADLGTALRTLDAEKAPAGVVLDLRNNPGGLVSASAGVAAAFLAQDKVLFLVRGRGPEEKVGIGTAMQAGGSGEVPVWARTVPLVVLVNGASASAAELLAGALQDHQRAIVVGSRTFGKGSIQNVIALTDDSAVKMTVARYATPLGREIQAIGLAPDRVVPAAAASGTPTALLLREADLAHHLPAVGEAQPPVAVAVAENAKLFGTRDDRALQAALAALQLAPNTAGAIARRLAAWGGDCSASATTSSSRAGPRTTHVAAYFSMLTSLRLSPETRSIILLYGSTPTSNGCSFTVTVSVGVAPSSRRLAAYRTRSSFSLAPGARAKMAMSTGSS
jgi:carboxyl-terminal processing protease